MQIYYLGNKLKLYHISSQRANNAAKILSYVCFGKGQWEIEVIYSLHKIPQQVFTSFTPF